MSPLLNLLEVPLPLGKTLWVTVLPGDVVRLLCFEKKLGKPTVALDPKGLRRARPVGKLQFTELVSEQLRIHTTETELVIEGNEGRSLRVSLDKLGANEVALDFSDFGSESPLYGMRSNALEAAEDPRLELSVGITRSQGAPVRAGSQGDGGAPLAYSKSWGVFVDSIDGLFEVANETLTFSKVSRKDLEAYVWFGDIKRTMAVSTALTGRHPLPPKWALGFMHSQWKTDEPSVLETVKGYRDRNIPLDVFIFDFDYKAWGEDDYGEWRWNSTSGPGSVAPNKFPNGQSGAFAKAMNDQGVTLVGIMKPRIMMHNIDGNLTKAAAEVTANGWWLKQKVYDDYMTHRTAHDLNFDRPALRKWYWKHSKGLYETGIHGWWNDEADDKFGSLGHLRMQQSLYEGQIKDFPNRRVWSLNRNFYPGSQRFAYATWSGDIKTGWSHMAAQRIRMMTTLGLGQPNWSMDSGGFIGDPTRENYARWIQFAAVTPVMRVHARYGLLRHPWVFGPKAESAATAAIRLRYQLLPSLYSWQRAAGDTGVGIVRPLHWEFPDDKRFENHPDSWLLGDALLVSPVVTQDKYQTIELPAGTWLDFWTGKGFEGVVTRQPNRTSFDDLPIFVRPGSIFASQDALPHTKATGPSQLTLHVYPSEDRVGTFEVYDDDGMSQEHTKGVYFSQHISAARAGSLLEIALGRPVARFDTSYKSYVIRVVGRCRSATWRGRRISVSQEKGHFEITLPVGEKGTLRCKLAR